MSQTPEEIALERIRQAAESSAEALDLKNLALKSLPDELWELSHLKELNVEQNQLVEISVNIERLVNLISLNISSDYHSFFLNKARNKIKRLPKELWSLPNLRKLNISFNDFESIPVELLQKKDWELLGLGGFELASLPPEVGQLQNLTQLDLSYNKLTSLPPRVQPTTKPHST